MTTKECGHDDDDRREQIRRLLRFIAAAIIIILIIILLIWLILRPTKPHFILQDATVYNFNVTQPNLLTATLQITLSSRNPNERIGVYYDRMDVFASYRNQQITLPTRLPTNYQGHKDITIWSPFIYGNSVPIAPFLATSLMQDQNAGIVLIHIKIDGRVKWKVGTWISGRYHIWVNCPAYITFGTIHNSNNNNGGVSFGNVGAIKYQLASSCQVDV